MSHGKTFRIKAFRGYCIEEAGRTLSSPFGGKDKSVRVVMKSIVAYWKIR
jgi:hypothetical protein